MGEWRVERADELVPLYRAAGGCSRGRRLRKVAIAVVLVLVGLVLACLAPPVRGLAIPLGPMFAAVALSRIFLGIRAARTAALLTLAITVYLARQEFLDWDGTVTWWVLAMTVGLAGYSVVWRG